MQRMRIRLLINMAIWFGVGYFAVFAAGLAAGCKSGGLYFASSNLGALLSLVFGMGASLSRFLNETL